MRRKNGSIMNVTKFIQLLDANPEMSIYIVLPDNSFIPFHFHITEVGRIHKQFVDCGGICRELTVCSLQVWVANDKDHRITTTKLNKIMKAAESLLHSDLLLIVEYGNDTISQYPIRNVEVTAAGLLFLLGSTPTACLAPDKCGVKGCC